MNEQWHHVVAVRDGTNAYLWVDGVLRDSKNYMFSPIRDPYNSSYNLYIGNSLNNYNYGYFYGPLDEYRIYNRALLPGEIQQLYAHGTLVQSLAAPADLTVAGSLTATGTVTFANAPPRLKPAGNLASGIYGQKKQYLVPNGQAAIWFPDILLGDSPSMTVECEIAEIFPYGTRQLHGFNGYRFWGFTASGLIELQSWHTVFPRSNLLAGSKVICVLPSTMATATSTITVLDRSGNVILPTFSQTVNNPQGTEYGFTLFGLTYDGVNLGCAMQGIGISSVKITQQDGTVRTDCVAVEKGSTKWSSTPAPSNCMWDKVTKAYRVKTLGSGSFSVVDF